MTAWISVIAGLIPILAFLIKAFLSDEAAKKAKEDQFQKDNLAHDQAVSEKVDENSQAQSQQSQNAGSAWDAADAEIKQNEAIK